MLKKCRENLNQGSNAYMQTEMKKYNTKRFSNTILSHAINNTTIQTIQNILERSHTLILSENDILKDKK